MSEMQAALNGLRRVQGVDLIAEEHRIPSGTDGVELFIRSRRPTSLSSYTPEKTIVMVHGATFSSGSLYDVPLNGFSFLDYLAMGGYDVHAVDIRGFGRSGYPQQMQESARAERPVVDTDMGVRDFATAVDFVRDYRRLSEVNVFAMSWGGSVAGAYTSRNSAIVRKLALLAPQWVSTAPIPLDPGGPLDNYRLVPVNTVKTRWLQNVPESGRAALIPQTWFEQWARATLAEDPWSAERTPEHIRATTGPIQDIRDFWAVGRPLYEPSAITVPTLLVHGEWDFTCRSSWHKRIFANSRAPHIGVASKSARPPTSCCLKRIVFRHFTRSAVSSTKIYHPNHDGLFAPEGSVADLLTYLIGMICHESRRRNAHADADGLE